ncbi:MAG: rhodanese-like domain-containing protein [Nevskiales bacterium]
MNHQIQHYENKLRYEIDAWDLFEAINNGDKVIVVDARSKEAFEVEHIPSAINIPHRSMNEATTADLDAAALYVVYCDGIGCNASTKGALNMTRLGFKVKELMGGIDWWRRDGYQTSGTQARAGKEIVCGC